jgi:hypothetical protein
MVSPTLTLRVPPALDEEIRQLQSEVAAEQQVGRATRGAVALHLLKLGLKVHRQKSRLRGAL